MADDIELKTKGLDQLIKAFKGKIPVARVGILGDSAREVVQVQSKSGSFTSKQGPTNAEVGAAHEFGQRSFLRAPLIENLNNQVKKSGGFDDAALKEVIKTGSIMTWMKKIAVIAENVVGHAFDTGNDGKWKQHAPGYTNNTGQILVDSEQLKRSISSEVK